MQIKPEKLRRYVNEFLLPSLNIETTISISTAVRWLKKLGFTLSRVRQGVYVDGHEREDVIVARQEFIKKMNEEVFPYVFPIIIHNMKWLTKTSGTVIHTKAQS